MAKVLTLEEQLAVAKDVLLQLKGQKIEAACGIYLEADVEGNGAFEDGVTIDMQKLLKQGKVKECSVCLRGAAFLSKARLYNDCPLRVEDGYLENLSNAVSDQSGTIFGYSTFHMESAFEGDLGLWGELYEDNAERMAAIIRNFIRNGGVFDSHEYIDPKHCAV